MCPKTRWKMGYLIIDDQPASSGSVRRTCPGSTLALPESDSWKIQIDILQNQLAIASLFTDSEFSNSQHFYLVFQIRHDKRKNSILKMKSTSLVLAVAWLYNGWSMTYFVSNYITTSFYYYYCAKKKFTRVRKISLLTHWFHIYIYIYIYI